VFAIFAQLRFNKVERMFVIKGVRMDKQTLRDFCMGLKGTEETFPFDAETAVYKVMGKMFALIPLERADDLPPTISLKCDPTLAQMLRQTYAAVQPGYHLNKKHWNTVTCDDTIPPDEVFSWIEDSYALVVKGLRKKDRAELGALEK